ncbi:hypothetical protein D9758_017452 [Tetrapyrgos nigripes]|uniref:DNA 3'-5' helicase n=1 Tax=Tetrapyrgos nigripes TaxID=182062 RepID=A0A8H5BR32_9AGAR|nr:hypothetical protein D9758_017452 [Tetrapyrgos nigripes]
MKGFPSSSMDRPACLPIDEMALRHARERLCTTFGVPSLCLHQERASHFIIQGETTMYDVPTGGGKTLSFWYPLFYHSEINPHSRKVVLVISPLNALMDAQVKGLEEKGIHAVALNSNSKAEDLFEQLQDIITDTNKPLTCCLKHQVIVTLPETALKSTFHEQLLKTEEFKLVGVSVIVDEAHCIAEWGSDFCAHYNNVGKLLAQCPSHVPVLIASAMMPQDTLIYVNTQKEAEAIQDFLRAHCPPTMSPDTIEFYHQHIDEERKARVEEGLQSGALNIVIATDALGMGMDFKNVRDEASDDEGGEDGLNDDDIQELLHQAMDPVEREAVIDQAEPGYNSGSDAEPDPELLVKCKCKKVKSAREARDLAYLTFFIAMTRCCCLPWDEFFDNADKKPPTTSTCCDNCQPQSFPVERIILHLPYPTQAGRVPKPTPELQTELTTTLKLWCTQKIAEGPGVVERLKLDLFCHIIPWYWGTTKYGNEVLALISFYSALYPDPEQWHCEQAAREEEHCQQVSIIEKDRWNCLVSLFNECYEAMLELKTGEMVMRGWGKDKKEVPERKCNPFLRLPNAKHWPGYYHIIKNPISMPHIKQIMNMQPENRYATVSQYVDAWRTMFANAHTFNIEDSDIYHTTVELERSFDEKLTELALKYDIELPAGCIILS